MPRFLCRALERSAVTTFWLTVPNTKFDRTFLPLHLESFFFCVKERNSLNFLFDTEESIVCTEDLFNLESLRSLCFVGNNIFSTHPFRLPRSLRSLKSGMTLLPFHLSHLTNLEELELRTSRDKPLHLYVFPQHLKRLKVEYKKNYVKTHSLLNYTSLEVFELCIRHRDIEFVRFLLPHQTRIKIHGLKGCRVDIEKVEKEAETYQVLECFQSNEEE